MKTLLKTSNYAAFYMLAALFLTLAMVAQAQAAPTLRTFPGKTSVNLDQGFVDALDSLGVALGIVRPAYLTQRKGIVNFPIPGGAIDLETFKGDIFHNGGLSLSAGQTRVKLLNFIIDTTNTPVLTGIVTVDGDVVGRLPLFNLELTSAPRVWYRKLIIRDVDLKLTAAAAEALNTVFGVDDFAEDFLVGKAKVKVLSLKNHGFGGYDNGDGGISG